MRLKADFPRPVREIEHTWIPLVDGARLAARIWLPEDAETNPVPAILEYLPYRKTDGTTVRDAAQHPYFAGHGYASVRVDLRGSGDSDGILYDEYLRQEQDDALEVLAWIAVQPWCTGAVGIIGISWGGFNGLQIAARRPPELKAIITLCSTDDRYNDDCHYMGGCVLGSDMLSWASFMFVNQALPPDPRFVGQRWREMWRQRLEETPPFIEAWLSHQWWDAYWKHGSVSEDYGAITCPVYAVGGWADPYTNTVLRLLAHLSAPRKGLIGPWAHTYPEKGIPGPAIGFLQEALRWWDYWLKGIDTGIMDEPMLRAWMQDSVEPRSYYDVRPGRWVAEPSWPAAGISVHSYTLNQGALDDRPAPEVRLDFQGRQYNGLTAGVWCPNGGAAELAGDQQAEDGLSLSFTSAPLDEPLEILGFPEVTLTVSVDKPKALLAVRLCDVAPTGASTLVTWALLNLTHRDSHGQPTPLEPGRRYTVSVRLNAIAHAIPAGHRWRLAISPTYWPHAWPSPEAVTLSLYTGGESRLHLPVRPPQAADADLASFEPPEQAASPAVEILDPYTRQRMVHHDVVRDRYQLEDQGTSGHRLWLKDDARLEVREAYTNTYTITANEPLSASVRCERMIQLARQEWRIRVETSSLMSADDQNFHVTNILDAYEGHTRFFTKSWTHHIPRKLV